MYNPQESLNNRIRGVLGGLDENQLPDTQIEAYEYLGKAIKEVEKRVGNRIEDTSLYDDIDSAIVYLCGSYFCPIMAIIQPQSEKSKQSQYTLQSIDYKALESELVNRAFEIIDDINSSGEILSFGGFFRTSNPS